MVDRKLTLVEHLDEIRWRTIKSVVFIIVIASLIYTCADLILPALVKPIGKLVFIAPTEAFITRIQIAFFGGLFFPLLL